MHTRIRSSESCPITTEKSQNVIDGGMNISFRGGGNVYQAVHHDHGSPNGMTGLFEGLRGISIERLNRHGST